jgi:hypothetical protein
MKTYIFLRFLYDNKPTQTFEEKFIQSSRENEPEFVRRVLTGFGIIFDQLIDAHDILPDELQLYGNDASIKKQIAEVMIQSSKAVLEYAKKCEKTEYDERKSITFRSEKGASSK